MRILFLSPYPYGTAASQRLKYEQYYSYLQSNGYRITTRSFFTRKLWSILYSEKNIIQKFFLTLFCYFRRLLLLPSLGRYDVVYIHLWVTPFGPPLSEAIAKFFAKKIVYDIDDMIFLSDTHSRQNLLVSFLKGRRKPLYLMSASSHVITCTPELNLIASRYCANTTDISSTIDTTRFFPSPIKTNRSPLNIGWTGTHSTLPYLLSILPILSSVYQSHEFQLFVIGNFSFEPCVEFPYQYVDWSKAEELDQLHQIDIGLYPLPADSNWVMGKSGLKAIQYMSIGIPVVAQNIGQAINRVVTHDYNGFLASTAFDWKKYIIDLLENPELRLRLGANGVTTVQAKFSVTANQRKYLNALD